MKQFTLLAGAALAVFTSTSAMALRPASNVIDSILNRGAAVDARHEDDDSREATKEQDKRERKRAKELRKQRHEHDKEMREAERERRKDLREAERERDDD